MNTLTLELNPSAQSCLLKFLLVILILRGSLRDVFISCFGAKGLISIIFNTKYHTVWIIMWQIKQCVFIIGMNFFFILDRAFSKYDERKTK
jgi:hypothetical protein